MAMCSESLTLPFLLLLLPTADQPAGFGPTYAATMSGIAAFPYYVHPSWLIIALCNGALTLHILLLLLLLLMLLLINLQALAPRTQQRCLVLVQCLTMFTQAGLIQSCAWSVLRCIACCCFYCHCESAGFGPTYAATLSGPASVPYYVHPSWPSATLCNNSALVLKDFAYTDQHGWQNTTEAAAAAAAAAAGSGANASSPTPPQQQQQQGQAFGSDVDAVDGSYSGTFLMHYTQSAVLCPQPISTAACPDPRNASACLAAAYDKMNPDRLMEPGAAAYRAAAGQRKAHYGVSVILPAVLASVLGEVMYFQLAGVSVELGRLIFMAGLLWQGVFAVCGDCLLL
jgi:hypothetical protein